jgi:hypothetical protein
MNSAIFSAAEPRPKNPQRRERRRPVRIWDLCKGRYEDWIDDKLVEREVYKSGQNQDRNAQN